MMKSCDACAKRVNEVRNFYGAEVCAPCAKDLREAYNGPQTMRSPVSNDVRTMDPHGMADAFDDFAPATERNPDSDDFAPETEWELNSKDFLPKTERGLDFEDVNPQDQDDAIGDAIAQTQRSPSHMKHESAKFDGDSYMDETVRLEEARNKRITAPVNQESIGHIRQLRTQELPVNRIRMGK